MRAPALLCSILLSLVAGVAAADVPSFAEREALAKLQAMDLFPALEDEKSGLAVEVAAETERLGREQPGFFKDAAWPVRVAKNVAARLGIRPLSVAEIRAEVTAAFEIDPAEFRRIHGIRLVSARFTTGGEWLDVTPQIAALTGDSGLDLECSRTLAVTLADEQQFERNAGEAEAEYWKRQRRLLAAAAEAREGKAKVEITFEFHSERFTASAKDGEKLTITGEGKILSGKPATPERAPKK